MELFQKFLGVLLKQSLELAINEYGGNGGTHLLSVIPFTPINGIIQNFHRILNTYFHCAPFILDVGPNQDAYYWMGGSEGITMKHNTDYTWNWQFARVMVLDWVGFKWRQITMFMFFFQNLNL